MNANTANNGGITAQTLNQPSAVYSNGTKLFIADSGNNRILAWNTIPESNQTPADFVLGQPNMTSNSANNGGTSSSSLSAPGFVNSDGSKLYVADTGNNRVLDLEYRPHDNAVGGEHRSRTVGDVQ